MRSETDRGFHNPMAPVPHERQGVAEPILFSENNLFPEALTLLNQGKQYQGPDLVQQIHQHCDSLDPQAKEMVEGILSDFGESILMSQGVTPAVNGLMAQLSQAKNRSQFFQALSQIRQFCQTLL